MSSSKKKKQQRRRLCKGCFEYIPTKRSPPDYSNVPSERDWQMSPFGNERYDLDERQRLEKKGVKGQLQLEALKKAEAKSPCPTCGEPSFRGPPYLPPTAQRCAPRYPYQPYGPPPVPLPTQPNPRSERNPLPNDYPSPNLMPSRCLACSTVEKLPPMQYPEYVVMNPCENIMAGYGYVPFGPTAGVKVHPNYYTPLGPSTLRTVYAHL